MKYYSYFILVLVFPLCTSLSQVKGTLWDQEQISNVTVLLYQQTSDTSPVSGSGTILSYDSAFYLLTASHVAKSMQVTAKIVFRLPVDKPFFADLAALTASKTFKWKVHPIADIAILELSPTTSELRKQLDEWSFPIKQIYSGKDLPNRDAGLTFLGYPVVDMEMEHFSPLVFTCDRASGLITQTRSDTKTKCNFFFLSMPSIQGCSGSGVYFSVNKSMYLGGDTTVLIGLIHGTMTDNTGGKLAAVTPSYYIFDLLK